jgi:hypothetical protein
MVIAVLRGDFQVMKFTIVLADLESLLKAIVSRPRKIDAVTLFACMARVFVDNEQTDRSRIDW